LATLGADRRVVLRDAVSFETLLPFPVGDGTPTYIVFDATGRRLAITHTGQDVAVWDLAALRDGLMEVGLAWDQTAPAVVPVASPIRDGEEHRSANPVLRRPTEVEPAAFEEVGRLVQSGVAAYQSGRLAEAIPQLQSASDRLRTLLKGNPKEVRLASNLGISLGFLGGALRDRHRPVDALAAFGESRTVLESIRNPAAVDLYNLACGYAQLSVLSQHAATSPSAAKREPLAVHAVEALRRSLAGGMRDFALMEHDHDLDPLRERPDFRKLLAEAQAKPEQKAKPKD
jgi:hypothetical protein